MGRAASATEAQSATTGPGRTEGATAPVELGSIGSPEETRKARQLYVNGPGGPT
jgi:hypothetical protein